MSRSRTLGTLMHVVVTAGVLREGQHWVCGLLHGRVRTMHEHASGARVARRPHSPPSPRFVFAPQFGLARLCLGCAGTPRCQGVSLCVVSAL